MKKILFILLFITSSFAQQRIWQWPVADTTSTSGIIIAGMQDLTGLGGLNYRNRQIKLNDLGAIIGRIDPNIVFRNKINYFTKDNYFADDIFLNSDSTRIQSTSYLSGFLGSGFSLYKTTPVNPDNVIKGRFYSGGYNLEVDNLLVRGTTYFNEVQLNQTKATNGNLWITDASTVDSVYYLETSDIKYNNGDPIVLENGDTLTGFQYQAIVSFQDPTNLGIAPFVVGDLLLYQQSRPRKYDDAIFLTKSIRAIVRKVVNTKVYMDLDVSSIDKNTDLRAIVEPGYTFSRVGHLSDNTRQGSVYFSVNELNSPKMIVYDSVSTFTDWDSFNKTRVVIGKLTGITDSTWGDLSQYTTYGGYFPNGTLFANDVRLDGQIVITSGSTKNLIDANTDSTSSNSSRIMTDSLGRLIVDVNPALLGATPRLVMDADNIGYWDGSTYKVYIANNGDFFFNGDATNFVSWNGSTLQVRGELVADDIKAGGTITGSSFVTSSTNQKIEIGANDFISFYWGGVAVATMESRDDWSTGNLEIATNLLSVTNHIAAQKYYSGIQTAERVAYWIAETGTELNAVPRLASSDITTTELGYLDGVTSNIQTQLNTKATETFASNASNLTTGTLANARLAATAQTTVFNATTGFRVGGGAADGNYLRGNGTNFISSQLSASDLIGTVDNARLPSTISGKTVETASSGNRVVLNTSGQADFYYGIQVSSIYRNLNSELEINTDALIDGYLDISDVYKVGGTSGVSGSFTTSDGKTVTVTGGIITAITGP